MSKQKQQPGRFAEFALLFAAIAIVIWLSLRPEPSISTLLPGTGIICTPSIERLRSQARPPLELPAWPFAPVAKEKCPVRPSQPPSCGPHCGPPFGWHIQRLIREEPVVPPGLRGWSRGRGEGAKRNDLTNHSAR